MARVRANVAALRTLRQVQAQQRPATVAELGVLARWSGWGAVPAVFDENSRQFDQFGWARDELTSLLSASEWAAASRNALNAHYTDAALAQTIWAAVGRLGFTGGRVLEPGCGAGVFLAFAPDNAELVGVEVEPVTAAIASVLHPHAEIRAESFADTRAPDGSFDLTVGNVPFARVRLTDARHNSGDHSIHNHFIIKGLHLTRPGGLVAVVTSRYTMDAPGPRQEMAALADLVGAVRLPSGAHRRAAGTDVVTDLLILRRREDDRAPDDTAWTATAPLMVDGASVRVNEYFLNHPQHVLGEWSTRGGLYRGDELSVTGDPDCAPALDRVLREVTEQAAARNLTLTPRRDAAGPARPAARVGPASTRPDGFLSAEDDGTFRRVEQGRLLAYTPPATQAAELRALLRLRDTVVALLEAEASTVDGNADMDTLRQRLNHDYDAYVARFGPINRFGQRRTGRTDPQTGQDVLARVFPPQGGFATDPFHNVVSALEDFDPVAQSARKADIFGQRVVAPRAPRLGAETAQDAVAICLDTHGEVRLSQVAGLLGVDETQARAELGRLVFDEPGTGRLVPAAEYLSGNVRAKLATARSAADEDPRFATNVTALAEVVPADLGPADIVARLGATWISPTHVRQFLADTLEDPTIAVEHKAGMWAVKSDRRRSMLATTRWGTAAMPAPDIAQALLEQRPIRVYQSVGDGKSVFSLDLTVAAQQKADELGERFAEWVWQDPQRAAELARVYNDRFNNLVLRSYDQAVPSLPGLALTFTPYPHQLAAVARIIAEPSVGLFHEVGAGKTAEMVMGAMELRRLGLVRKPAIVVPNHMLAQFQREALQLYPQARILAASTEDLRADRRRRFVGRVATGDWDMVIMTRSAFERLPMSEPARRAYLETQVDEIAAAMQAARQAGEKLLLKRLEAAKLQAEERVKKMLAGDRKDPGITFEQTGIDYLFMDEAHHHKNLFRPSNVPDLALVGDRAAGRASDLHMKIEWLRQRSPRVCTLATATPIANSMAEAHTMLRYLRPDLLEQAGIDTFDAFIATFGRLVTAVEVAPDGTGLRMKARVAQFVNVPELLKMWNVAGDIKTADDLELAVPALAERAGDGQRLPETVTVAASAELRAFIAEFVHRADAIRNRAVTPDEDNFLKIANDGRAAALDLRLVGRRTDEPGKLDAAAGRIAQIWHQFRDQVYRGEDGQPHPRPGALQLVFADLGTPSRDWNVYDALRGRLVALGLPRERVRFIHEARDDKAKAELFAACRDGRVAVLIGSTDKMGVGTNVQTRAVALHHLDCPWRPADVQQREGRIVRQRNQNDEVQILRYATEGSFDGFTWGTVSRKAHFIAQVMRGRLDVREIEDIGDAELSYNEVKALATGNPLLLDHAEAQADVARLERLERAHHHAAGSLRFTIRDTERTIDFLQARVEAVDAAIARRVSTRGDAFAMTVGEHTHTQRPDALARLRVAVAHLLADPATPAGQPRTVGALGGFEIQASIDRDSQRQTVTLSLADVPYGELVALSRTDLAEADLVARLENRLHALDTLGDNARTDITRAQRDISQAQQQLDTPFRHAQSLADARERLAGIETQLTTAAGVPGPAAQAPADRPTNPPTTVDEPDPVDRDTGGPDSAATPTPTAATPVARWAFRTPPQVAAATLGASPGPDPSSPDLHQPGRRR
jgi:N12 class adenine-specific DNA methylase